jgi:DNA-binding NtrC family response regulator
MEQHGAVRRYRILVIDDNPDIHADFRKILCESRGRSSRVETAEAALFGTVEGIGRQSEFDVDSAFQAAQGLAKVYHAIHEGRPYAMAFVDVRMPPGWDGIEVTPRLWVADPDLQIVICTAYSDYTWEEIFNRLGTSDRMVILKKPFDPMEIMQLAHTLTEKRRRLNEGKPAKPGPPGTGHTEAVRLERTALELQSEILRLKREGGKSE